MTEAQLITAIEVAKAIILDSAPGAPEARRAGYDLVTYRAKLDKLQNN